MPSRLSQTEVAKQLNIPLSTLRGYIDKFNWERDLAPEVQRRTNMAVMKAALGAPLDRPLTNEESAIQERVALNVAIITQHQDWLTGFGDALNNLMQHHVAQAKDLSMMVDCTKSASGFREVRKNLGPAIGESRQLIAAFAEFAQQQRLAHGIDKDGDGKEVDVDSYLRELAEEMHADTQEADTGEA